MRCSKPASNPSRRSTTALPQALQERGGWQSRDTAKAFADYAAYVAGHLSDRAKHFFTINEFFSIVDIGHRGIDTIVDGKKARIELAPGLRLPNGSLNQMRHNAVLAQGLSVQGDPRQRQRPAPNADGRQPLDRGAGESKHPKISGPREIATREMNRRLSDRHARGRNTPTPISRRPARTRRNSPPKS